MKRMSFRIKMLAAFSASVLLAIFIVLALSNYYVNILQKSNVEAAVTLATEQARQLSREMLTILAERQTEDINSPELRERLRTKTEIILEMNKNVVWAAVVDGSGNRVIERSTGNEIVVTPQALPEGTYSTDIPSSGGQQLQVTVTTKQPKLREIKYPVQIEGRRLADVVLRVTEDPAFRKIEATSQQITLALIAECCVLLLFLIAVFVIISRLFNSQLRLVQRNAELDRMAYVGTLASGLAHEIRNPLSAMNVNLEVMREELVEPQADGLDRATKLASRVQKEVLQLNTILSSFLDFALPNRENLSAFPLTGVVKELVELHEEQMKQAGINCELSLPPPEKTEIEADRRLIFQACRNVFVNALQVLTGSVKKELRIAIEPLAHERFRLTVRDSGPGIRAEHLPQLFDVFFTTRKGGVGFGLAITRKIIEEHGGTITASNNPDSMGAVFTIELPRHTTIGQVKPPAQSPGGRLR